MVLFYIVFLTIRLYIQSDQFKYFPDQPSNTISLGTLKICVGSKNVTSKSIEHCDFFDTQGRSWRSPYQTHNNIDYIQLKIVNINPHRDKNVVVPTICGISKQTPYQLIYQRFGHVDMTKLKQMAIK